MPVLGTSRDDMHKDCWKGSGLGAVANCAAFLVGCSCWASRLAWYGTYGAEGKGAGGIYDNSAVGCVFVRIWDGIWNKKINVKVLTKQIVQCNMINIKFSNIILYNKTGQFHLKFHGFGGGGLWKKKKLFRGGKGEDEIELCGARTYSDFYNRTS